jgi:hypothetical protein
MTIKAVSRQVHFSQNTLVINQEGDPGNWPTSRSQTDRDVLIDVHEFCMIKRPACRSAVRVHAATCTPVTGMG